MTMLTIKILFTIISLKKKTIPSKHYLQFLSFEKKTLGFAGLEKIRLIIRYRIKNISFQLKQSISIFLKKDKQTNYSKLTILSGFKRKRFVFTSASLRTRRIRARLITSTST